MRFEPSTFWSAFHDLLISVDSTKSLVSLSLSSLGLTIVTRSSQAVLDILKNYKRSRTQLQASSSKVINEIVFHPSYELFTGCPSKHVSNKSCQYSVTLFSLNQPLLFHWYSSCLSVWPSSCPLSIKTAPLLIWPKNSTHSAHKDQNIWTSLIFPCCSFCLEFCLMKLHILSQPLHLKLPWRLICSNPLSAS